MTIEINADKNLIVQKTFGNNINELLVEELSRFSEQITRVEVHFSDQNGNKSGSHDKKCLLEARLKTIQPLVVTDKSSTYDLALNGAIDKLKTTIESVLGKLQNF